MVSYHNKTWSDSVIAIFIIFDRDLLDFVFQELNDHLQ